MLDWIDVVSISISMSVDAMTVNATNGIREAGIKKWKLIIIALVFGVFQFVMPTIGYFISTTFSSYLESIKIAVPIIAFVLLFLLALNSLREWIKDFNERKKEKKLNENSDTNGINLNEVVEKKENKKLSFWNIFVQGIATSIDALCIGFAYMNLTIGNAMLFFGIIGVTTFVLSMLTGLFGNVVSKYLEKWASLIAAIVFLAIGLKILIEGLI